MKLSGSLLVLIGALCWSITGTIQSFAPQGAAPFTITEARMIVGAVGLFGFCLLAGKLPKHFSDYNLKYTFLVALSLYVYQLLFFSSILKVGVAVGTVVSIGSTPVWTAIVEKIFFKKSPSKIWYWTTLVAIVGIILINVENFKANVDLLYVALPALAGLCFCGEIIFAPKAMEKASPEATMTMVMLMVSVMNAPALFFYPIDWVMTAQGATCALALGLITAAFAFALFFTGVKTCSATVASTLSLAEPMGAACLGIFLLNEPCSIWTVLGIFLILASIVVLALSKTETAKS